MWLGIPLLIVVGWIALVLSSWRRPELGLAEGKLRRCPSSPNCVCSEGESDEHAIDPLTFTGSADEAWSRLITLLEATPHARLITHDGHYLHAEFVTPWMRFVDDVEFRLTPEVIHVRSASRVGRSDLGANRSRIEKLRQGFTQPPP